MKKFLIIFGVIFLVLVGFMGYKVVKDLPEAKQVSIASIDVSKLEDGAYQGKYDFSRWENEVEVTVQQGKITAIKLLDGNTSDKISEEVINKVIEKQNLDIDAVTGATVSTKMELKAIEDALTQK